MPGTGQKPNLFQNITTNNPKLSNWPYAWHSSTPACSYLFCRRYLCWLVNIMSKPFIIYSSSFLMKLWDQEEKLSFRGDWYLLLSILVWVTGTNDSTQYTTSETWKFFKNLRSKSESRFWLSSKSNLTRASLPAQGCDHRIRLLTRLS